MIAVLKGDVIGSRKVENQDLWLTPLQEALNYYGKRPQHWDLAWGDAFQLVLEHPDQALAAALHLRSSLVKINWPGADQQGKHGPYGVRIAIGLGEMDYSAARVFECNGSAFVRANEAFEHLEQQKAQWLVNSGNAEWDREINLYLRLAETYMNRWSRSSAALMEAVLLHPGKTQSELGEVLGIRQNSVSGRWRRAHIEESLAVLRAFQEGLRKLGV